MPSKRCISFVAVSSLPQAEEVSLDEQSAINEANAQRIGGHIVERLRVPGHTREYDTLAEIAVDVDAYAQMRRIIDDKSADVLLAYTPDRLARTPALLMDISQKCWRAGIALYIHSLPAHSLDPQEQANSLSQQLLLAFAGVQAGNEIAVLRQRHRFGMAARVKRKQKFPSLVPYGYMEEAVSPKETRIVPDPETAHVVRWILVDLYVVQGMGTGKIAALLNARRVVTPSARRGQLYGDKRSRSRVWTPIMVRRLAERANRYAGYLELNKSGPREYVMVRGTYAPLINDEELATVEAELRKRTQGPNATYRLSGLCRCGDCGTILHINRHEDTLASGAIAEYMYMQCKVCKLRCRYPDVVQNLVAAFDAIEADPDLIRRKRDDLVDREAALVAQVAAVTAELGRVDEATARLLDALEDATMPQAQIAERLRQRQADRRRFESDRTQLEKDLETLRRQPDPLAQIAALRTGAVLLLGEGDDAEINQKLSQLMQYALVYASGQVEIYL